MSETEGRTSEPNLTDPQYYLNRELSELAYQERVLSEGTNERSPPLERLRFLAFFTKNTARFFMKRVGGLTQQVTAGVTVTTPDGRTPSEQLHDVIEAARPLFRRQDTYWQTELKPELADVGIAIREYDDLNGEQRDQLRTYFEESVLPTLTPLAFDPAHPFPFISNLSLSLAVLTKGPGDGEPRFSRVKIPKNRPRLVPVSDDATFVRLEEVIAANLDLLFPKAEIVDC